MTPIVEERNTEPHVPEAEYRIASVEKRPVHKRKVEDYLQNLHRGRPAPQTSEATEVFNLDDEESDQDSVAEEAGEDEPYEGSLQHLDQMRHFILKAPLTKSFVVGSKSLLNPRYTLGFEIW
ncbi:hypothetical protein N7460_012416 [Penicillium canescens]|uniref:Uncharacterized protein n=1 Tax=Penicillium canescens TaxID=5083 RepID=A0AAD6N3Q3_PENCN|nr:hypothetical protein N7460_012416 [Penicillium canescens]